MNKHSNLLQRAKLICNSNGIIMLHKYLFNESYAGKCKPRFKCDIADGIADLIILFYAHMIIIFFVIEKKLPYVVTRDVSPFVRL